MCLNGQVLYLVFHYSDVTWASWFIKAPEQTAGDLRRHRAHYDFTVMITREATPKNMGEWITFFN